MAGSDGPGSINKMTKIYTATSWKNEKTVKMLAKMLRDWGHEVYCFAEEADNQAIFDWSDVTGPDHDGISALETPVSGVYPQL